MLYQLRNGPCLRKPSTHQLAKRNASVAVCAPDSCLLLVSLSTSLRTAPPQARLGVREGCFFWGHPLFGALKWKPKGQPPLGGGRLTKAARNSGWDCPLLPFIYLGSDRLRNRTRFRTYALKLKSVCRRNSRLLVECGPSFILARTKALAFPIHAVGGALLGAVRP